MSYSNIQAGRQSLSSLSVPEFTAVPLDRNTDTSVHQPEVQQPETAHINLRQVDPAAIEPLPELPAVVADHMNTVPQGRDIELQQLRPDVRAQDNNPPQPAIPLSSRLVFDALQVAAHDNPVLKKLAIRALPAYLLSTGLASAGALVNGFLMGGCENSASLSHESCSFKEVALGSKIFAVGGGMAAVVLMATTVLPFAIRTGRQLHQYTRNPNDLINRLETMGTVQFPEYAYQNTNEKVAKEIHWNLKKAVHEIPLMDYSVVQQEIKAISTTLNLNSIHKERLNNMLNESEKAPNSLVWTYLAKVKTGDESNELKRLFVEHLAKSEGCPHGRESQILSFFNAGIDAAIYKLQPKTLVVVPTVQAEKNDLMSHIFTAIQHGQEIRSGSTGEYSDLKEEPTLAELKAFLKPIFVKGNSYHDFEPNVKMRQNVLDVLVREVKANLDGEIV